jgi:hypothetical protein
VAYRAEIEIAVKGARDLTQFQGKLKATALEVEQLNKFLKAFSQDAEGIPRSIANLNKQLNEASSAFNEVALGTKEARTAAIDYLAATRNLNAGLKERAALLAEVAENERKVKLASAGIKERTQYSGPIGPGQASPVNALAGQSSEVAGRVQRIKDIKEDQRTLDKALLDLEKKSAAELSKKVQLQENLVKGTREVLELAAEAQRKQQFRAGKSGSTQLGPLAGPGAFGFPVALPLTAAEQKGLEIATKKQQILQRTVKTRQNLVGLAANLQRLETRTTVAIADAKREQQQLNDQKQRALQLSERQLQISKQGARLAGRFNDIKGAKNIPGSPKFIEARARRRKEALGSAIIGGAFPLLFGQGIGAAAGGGLGGAAGGLVGGQFGFGLSLVGTALGQAVDDFIASTTKLAQSLKSPAESLEALGEAGLNVDESSKMLVKSLLESGKAVEAQQVAFDEINKTLGPNAVKRLTAFDEQSKRIQTAFGEMSAGLQSELAPYLITATYLVANMTESLKNLTKVKLPWWLDLALRATPAGFAMGAAKDVGNLIAGQTKEPLVQDKTLEQRRKDYQLRKTFNQEELQYRKESTSLLGRELELLKMTGAEDKYRRSTLQAQLNVDQQRLAVRKATDAVNRAGGDVSAEISARKQQFAALDALKRAEAEAEVARAAERVFNLYSKQADALQQVVTASKLRLQNEQAVAEGRNKLTGAYYNAELKIKDLAIQRAKQRGDANAVLQLELEKVQLIYKQTVAQIQAEVERTRLKYRQVQLATKELEVANLRKKAEGKLQQADVDAMKVQQQALKIAGYNVSVSEQVANQQIRGAQAVFAASAESLIYANNQNKVADAAERTARAQERAAKAIAGAGAEPVDAFPKPKLSFFQKGSGSGGIGYGIGFAEGGYVTKPTKAMVGERGENEYVIPESKMRSSMERYARGARGESVVEGNGSSNGMGSRTTRGTTTVNVSTGPVMRMGNKDYVTVADLNNAVGSVVATLSRDTSNKYGKSPRVS